MTNKPLVSIIMNCFNGAKYLSYALESIKKQTYENWELIFWDNCSTDNSSSIFKKYSDTRFKYYLAKNHTGISKAKNFAIEKSNGDLIGFLDVDDMWEANKLEVQAPLFLDQEVGVAYSNFWLIKNNETKKRIFSKKKLFKGHIYNKILSNYNVGLVTTIIRKKYLDLLEKKFDERYGIIADFDLILRLAKNYTFACSQDPLAYYRLHTTNYSIINKNKEISDLEFWLKENTTNLGEELSKKIQERIDSKRFIQSKINGDIKTCFTLIRKSKLNSNLIKKFFIILLPRFLLKKISWFYQNNNN